jgi:hypothetical protein
MASFLPGSREDDGAEFRPLTETHMKKMIIAAAILSVAATACKKTGDGGYEVQKPVVGTVTDTIHTPVVETGVDSTKVAVPKVEVKRDSATIKVPTVTIKKP